MSNREQRLVSALEVITKQYAFRGHTKDNQLCLHTGGMPHLEAAFNVLGWDDPLVLDQAEVERVKCSANGCTEWATVHMVSGSLKDGRQEDLCTRHYWPDATKTTP